MKRLIITNLEFALKNGLTYFELATLERKITESTDIQKRIKTASGFFHLEVASVYPDGKLEYLYKFEFNPF